MSRFVPRFPPALRFRDFRLFWSGLFVSVIGSQMQLIAINWHIYDLLRGETVNLELFGRTIELGAQALGLGTLGLVRVVPIILFALFGGMLADTRNRRSLLLFTEGFDVAIAAILAILTLTGQTTIWHIYLISALLAAMNAQWLERWDVAPRSHPNDGLLDLFDGSPSLDDRWKARRRLITGTHVPHPAIVQRRTDALELELDPPLDVYLDGVKVGRGRHLEIRVEPDALTCVV